MKKLVDQFLSEAGRRQISEAVKAAEKYTSGEIVPMVVSASDRYAAADIVGGAAFGFPLALIVSHFVGAWFWLGTRNLWLFLAFLFFFFIVCHAVIKRTCRLKRFFISSREMNEKVEEAAFIHFYRNGLHHTRDETGILMFISVLERKVVMLADRGINNKVPEGQWDTVVKKVVEGIQQHRQVEAVCGAVEAVGDLLKEHFPIKPDDNDELRNLIVEE
jgi:putative membrane protein